MLGAQLSGSDRVSFSVWAPKAKQVFLRLTSSDSQRELAMTRGSDAVFWCEV